MGNRYILDVTCPKCRSLNRDVYYAPTCDFVTHRCRCGHEIDLEEATGITYEEASNLDEIRRLVEGKTRAVPLLQHLHRQHGSPVPKPNLSQPPLQ